MAFPKVTGTRAANASSRLRIFRFSQNPRNRLSTTALQRQSRTTSPFCKVARNTMLRSNMIKSLSVICLTFSLSAHPGRSIPKISTINPKIKVLFACHIMGTKLISRSWNTMAHPPTATVRRTSGARAISALLKIAWLSHLRPDATQMQAFGHASASTHAKQDHRIIHTSTSGIQALPTPPAPRWKIDKQNYQELQFSYHAPEEEHADIPENASAFQAILAPIASTMWQPTTSSRLRPGNSLKTYL